MADKTTRQKDDLEGDPRQTYKEHTERKRDRRE
jgi:hypothetical protein